MGVTPDRRTDAGTGFGSAADESVCLGRGEIHAKIGDRGGLIDFRGFGEEYSGSARGLARGSGVGNGALSVPSADIS